LNDSDEKSAVTVRTVDVLTAVIIFSLGAIVCWDSYRIGAGWAIDGPEAGYFPFYIGLILCVASVVNFINALRKANKAEGDASFVSVTSLKTVCAVLIPTIVYVCLIGGIGPIPGLGIYVASTIFIAMFMLWLGKYRWPLTLAVSVSVPIVFFLMFEIWFNVPLPKGPFEALIGLD
jgi:putative tricarboxylic transport membrane protein